MRVHIKLSISFLLFFIFACSLVKAEVRSLYPFLPMDHISPELCLQEESNGKSELSLSKEDRNRFSYLASELAYLIPDLDKKISVSSFLNQGRRLYDSALNKDYEVIHIYSEPSSGLKYITLKPKNKRHPYILAFTGTQTTLDWLTNLNFGIVQLNNFMQFASLLALCKSVPPLLITGHSLGGGLAQAVGYSMQEYRLSYSLARRKEKSLQLEVVTWNAFGAVDVASKTGFKINPSTLRWVPITNYIYPGDPVSKIGKHIGLTIEVRPVYAVDANNIFSTEVRVFDPIWSHSLSRFDDYIYEKRFHWREVHVDDSSNFSFEMKAINRVYYLLPDLHFSLNREDQLELIQRIQEQASSQFWPTTFLNYLKNLKNQF